MADNFPRFIREPERRRLTGVSSTTWWRMEKRGEVPRRVSINGNSVGWVEQEVLDWMQQRIAMRDQEAAAG